MFAKIFLYVFSLIVFCSSILRTSAEDLPHNCSRSQFDDDLSQIIGPFAVKGVNFPTNEEEMDKYCKLATEKVELSIKFREKCLTGYPKTVMFSFSSSLKSFLAQFCGDTPTERENFIAAAECGNKAKEMGNRRCWNRLLTNLYKTRHMEDPEDRVPGICCQFLSWRTCTLNTLKEVEECDENIIEIFDKQIKKICMDPMIVLCDEYFEEPTMCIDIIAAMPKFDPSQRRRVNTKTPLLGIFKIFESFH